MKYLFIGSLTAAVFIGAAVWIGSMALQWDMKSMLSECPTFSGKDERWPDFKFDMLNELTMLDASLFGQTCRYEALREVKFRTVGSKLGEGWQQYEPTTISGREAIMTIMNGRLGSSLQGSSSGADMAVFQEQQ